MRKIKIYNKDMTVSVQLYSNTILASGISGFGSKRKLNKIKNKVVGFEEEFENISLELYFGVNGNAYDDYDDLMELINENGAQNLVLGYDYNEDELLCDIHLINAPKTQKDEFNVIVETFVFERVTPWYIAVEEYASSYPFVHIVSNVSSRPIDLIISASLGAGVTDKFVVTKKVDGIEVARIQLNDDFTKAEIEIDGEEKTVIHTDWTTLEKTSAYELIDKEYQTFLACETGNTTITMTPLLETPDYYRIAYKKWVV